MMYGVQGALIDQPTEAVRVLPVGTMTVSGTLTVGTLPNVNQGTGNAGTSPWAVSGTVAVTQSTSPWVVAGATNLDDTFSSTGTVEMVGSCTMGLTQGAFTLSRIKAHDYSSDGKVTSINGLAVQSYPWVFNGASEDRVRTPSTFKNATATASGNTALWTPTSGKKFRVMKYMIEVTANASLAGAAILTISLYDANGVTSQIHSVFVPTVAVVTAAGNALTTGWVDLGNGFLSAAADNALSINLDAALVTGACRVIVCGMEE